MLGFLTLAVTLIPWQVDHPLPGHEMMTAPALRFVRARLRRTVAVRVQVIVRTVTTAPEGSLAILAQGYPCGPRNLSATMQGKGTANRLQITPMAEEPVFR